MTKVNANIWKTLLRLLVFASLGQAQYFNATPPTLPPSIAVQQAANKSTGNPGFCPGGTKFFPQPIDHATFNGDYNAPNATFLQQYNLNDTFYKPGGPIFFLQGTENSVFTCPEYSIGLKWAQKFNGLMVGIEHRYFGMSCPYGLNYSENANWDSSLLAPLTLENALRDAVSLLAWIKTVAYPTAKDSKVIMYSGSYGGTLATLFQVHYPDYIYASIAESSPIRGLISDPNDPLAFGIGDWNMVFNDYSAEAATTIQQGMMELTNMGTKVRAEIRTKHKEGIRRLFKFAKIGLQQLQGYYHLGDSTVRKILLYDVPERARPTRTGRPRESLNEQESQILYSDEVTFQVGGKKCKQRCIRNKKERCHPDCIQFQMHRGGTIPVHFFGAVGYGYKSPLINIHGTGKSGAFTQTDYLAQVLKPYIQDFLAAFAAVLGPGKTPQFMEDGNSAHGHKTTSNICATWRTSMGITLFPHPAVSPDMNPIEKCWRRIKQALHRRLRQPTTEVQMVVAVLEEWDKIPQEWINGLIEQQDFWSSDLLTAILKTYASIVQGNYASTKYPFQQTLNATLAANISLSAISSAISISNTVNKAPCLDWNPSYSTSGTEGRAFTWLRCTQIPYPNPFSTAETIWGPILPDYTQAHLMDPYCQAAFNMSSIDGGAALQRKLGLDQYTLENTERLLMTEHLLDPIAAYGPLSWNPGSSRQRSRIMYIGQSAHAETLQPPARTDSEALVMARIYISNSIAEWLS
ncbi:uncharacterized protein LY89DRAFT_672563 [Mollisia scopiformis]|uniref:Tc1-like transposase DDE domain-containing protein n=1 Tax=Mollisia scopiformis TaxID=149040 RepID=A0A194WZG7_MOLSC|nr:uncharacterized protein LY89DRAFT_672563 [Mollisia scopiformis]KUJ13345.1 hypothetical protein LY89DRAFT_672563 [Mollisia scopiformis]